MLAEAEILRLFMLTKQEHTRANSETVLEPRFG